MTSGDRKAVTIGGIILIILLLLWWKFGRALDTILVHDKPTTIDVEAPPGVTYELPPIVIPHDPGAWDWMQTTDLSCGCDAGLFQGQQLVAPVIMPVAYPVYKYVNTTTYEGPNNYNFPTFTPPANPTWWYEWGKNVMGEVNRQYIMTSEGTTLIGGKYSRAPDQWGTYGDQTKYDWTQSGPNIYYNGKRFVHDTTRDYPHPQVPVVPTYAFGTA